MVDGILSAEEAIYPPGDSDLPQNRLWNPFNVGRGDYVFPSLGANGNQAVAPGDITYVMQVDEENEKRQCRSTNLDIPGQQ